MMSPCYARGRGLCVCAASRLNELLKVVVVAGCVGRWDVVTVLLLDFWSSQSSSFANAEDKEQEIDTISCHTNNADALNDKNEKISQVTGHGNRG